MTAAIPTKSPEQIERMRAAGRIVHRVLEHCRSLCKPGVTTREIDEAGAAVFEAAGGRGLFKNYPTYREGEGFPANLCISVNEEVVHGIAGDRELEEGDLVSVDCGVQLDGWCGDSATTIPVGRISADRKRLCEVTQHVLQLAIENMKPGAKWSSVASLMQRYAERSGMSVVRDFVGHGIGQKMHEEPKIPNYWRRGRMGPDFELRPGMVLAVEPMCNLGRAEVVTLDDGWTVVTSDGKASAHYEHTIAVTDRGADVLTDGR